MEPEATLNPGASNQPDAGQTGGDDAALLSAYLAQQEPDGNQPSPESGARHDAQDPAAQPDPEPVFTVKIDGEDKTVSRDELVANYQKAQASAKRFEEAAAVRKEAEAQRSQLLQQQQMLSNALNHFQQLSSQLEQTGQPDWNKLLQENPHEYLLQRNQWEQRQQALQQAQTAQAYLQQQQQQQQQHDQEQRLAQESEKLLTLVPEWKDDSVRQKDQQALVDFLQREGYSAEDIQGLAVSRASNIRLALNAMRYEQLTQRASQAKKQVQTLPPRVEAPGSAQAQRGNREAINRLQKTGSIDDAAAAFAELFGG